MASCWNSSRRSIGLVVVSTSLAQYGTVYLTDIAGEEEEAYDVQRRRLPFISSSFVSPSG
ncbi:hypothetical protein TYRP_004003 [Tyrophagus putrescentiae]|nr:hypothetical protein TYRP_004003 [Tyrophagus putrescentiae]